MNILRSFFGTSPATISPRELHTLLAEKASPFVLDVRQPDEYRAGHIQGAKLIPLDQLEGRIGELPQDRDIICVCRSGARSGVATRHLINAGYKARNLSGGMVGWQRAGLPVKKGR